MKKTLSFFMAVIMISICFLQIPAVAIEPPFDINNYTLDDFIAMNMGERKKLMDKFIETYNPYGIRDLMAEERASMEYTEPGISPQWESYDGTGLIEKTSMHQFLTMEAFSRYVQTDNPFETDGTTALVLVLELAAASGLPDKDEDDWGFRAHFYDPDTGNNYLFQSNPTAKTKVQEHYDAAYKILKKEYFTDDYLSDEYLKAIEELGRALHFIQDLCEPHHASNKIAGVTNHSQFESYVGGRMEMIFETDRPLNRDYYNIALNISAGDLAHKAAQKAKPKYELIKDNEYNYSVAYTTAWESVYFSSALIYKLYQESFRDADFWGDLIG